MTIHLSNQNLIKLGALILIAVLIFNFNQGDKTTEEETKEEVKVTDEIKAEEEITPSETETEKPEESTPVKTITTTNTTKKTNTVTKPSPTRNCKITLSAKSINKPRSILLKWNRCESEDFQLYRLLKSTSNPKPSFPNDPVILASNNQSETNFADKIVQPAITYHYRLCVYQKLKDVICSNTVSETY